MNLTSKELEIMSVLWGSDSPMTANDLIDTSPERTWQEVSLYTILKNLVAKGVVVVDHHVKTAGRDAKAYRATHTAAQYAVLQVNSYGVSLKEFMAAYLDGEEAKEALGEGDGRNSYK